MPRMALKAKEFRYAIDLHEGGALRTEDGTPLAVDPAWSPEHLLLAALVRCTLKSLGYHARRGHIEVSDAHGSARALFAKREADERYAVVECEVELDGAAHAEARRRRARGAARESGARLLHRRVADGQADYRWTVR